MYKFKLSAAVLAAIVLSGCANMSLPGSKNSNKGGISTTTAVAGGTAVAAGVGLLAIPFVGPVAAGIAYWSYGNDIEKAAAENQKVSNNTAAAKRAKCAALYDQADKGGWSNAKTNARAYREGCK